MAQRHLVQNWPSHLEVRRSTRAFLPPINSLDPAGHKTSRAPRAWHVPKGCGTNKTTHMPNLGDSRRVRASAKENELSQRLYGARRPAAARKTVLTALARWCVQVQKRRALYDSSVVLLGSSLCCYARSRHRDQQGGHFHISFFMTMVSYEQFLLWNMTFFPLIKFWSIDSLLRLFFRSGCFWN